MTNNSIDLHEKLALIKETWAPHIVDDFNDCYIKLAKFDGEFTFHRHEDSDELFIALEGGFFMVFRDRKEWIAEGSMITVKKGVDHHTSAPDPCSVLIIGKKSSDHTGGVQDPPAKRRISSYLMRGGRLV